MSTLYKYQFYLSTSNTARDSIPNDLYMVEVGVDSPNGSMFNMNLVRGALVTSTNYTTLEIENSNVSSGAIIDITFSGVNDTQITSVTNVIDSESGDTYSGTLYLWCIKSSHESGTAFGDDELTSYISLSTGEHYTTSLNGGFIATDSNPSWISVKCPYIEACSACGYNNAVTISLDTSSQNETAIQSIYSAMDSTTSVSPSNINVVKTYSNNVYQFSFSVDGFTPSSSSQPATLDEIMHHLGSIKYPHPDGVVLLKEDIDPIDIEKGFYKIIDAELIPKAYPAGISAQRNLFVVTNSSLHRIDNSSNPNIVVDSHAINLRVQFAVDTAITATGTAWAIGYLSPDVIPGYAWEPMKGYETTGYRGGDTLGHSDAAGTVFGVFPYCNDVPSRADSKLIVQGLGYVRKDKATTGHTVTTDYLFNVRLIPNIKNMIAHYDECKDYLIPHYARTVAYAKYDSSNNVLTFFRDFPGKYTNGQTIGTETYYTDFEDISSDATPTTKWSLVKSDVRAIVFQDTIRPKNCYQYFCNMSNLEKIYGLDMLDTSNTKVMTSMFEGCFKLTQLDLSFLDTSRCEKLDKFLYGCLELVSVDISSFKRSKNLTTIHSMFRGCRKLETIYCDGYLDYSDMTDSEYVFIGCNTLIGGKGTKLTDSLVYDGSYARMDDPDNGKPGYFTKVGEPYVPSE